MSTAALFPVVLVMLALDEHDPSVLTAVANGAKRLGAQTIVLSHVSPLDPLAGALGMGSDFDASDCPSELTAAKDRLAASLPDCTFVLEHARGAVDAELEDIVARHNADLLVIGRLNHSGSPTGWGPSGRKLLRSVDCSVLVVPEGAHLDFQHVVVGLDFSSHSAFALALACELSDRTTAVVQYDLRVAGHGSLTDVEFATELKKNAREHFENTVRPQLPASANPDLEIHPGDRASDVLLERSGEEVLVVGSRGLSKLATVLLGSTAERLAGKAAGPVLIVRKKGEVMSLLEGLFHR